MGFLSFLDFFFGAKVAQNKDPQSSQPYHQERGTAVKTSAVDKMAPSNYKNSPRNLADTDGRKERIRQLELDLHQVQDQLRKMSLSNASQLLVITQVYNLASMSEEGSPTVAKIKRLIESNQADLRVKLSTSPTFSSSSGCGSVTPPSTEPHSRQSVATSSGNASADESGDEETKDAGKSSGGSTTEPHSPMVVSEQHDLLGLSLSSPGKSNDSKTTLKALVADKSMPESTHIALPTGDMPQDKRSISKSNTEAVTDNTNKVKPLPKVDTDDADAMWQEFSLEEELEGIADAPAKNREAMRAALREKEEETRKRLRASAEEKRRIAEKEGDLLKKAFSRLPAQMKDTGYSSTLPEKPKELDNNSSNNSRGKYSQFTARNFSPSTRKASTQSKVKVPEKKQTTDAVDFTATPPASSLHAATPVPEPEVEDSDSDADDTNSIPGIINIETESPKNADRFGIVFDPSKLDAATVAEVCGTDDWKDNRRSLLIQNIPHEYSMHKLLAHVRGGKVVTARLAPDVKGAGHGLVAMVTFKTSKEAAASEKITSALLARSEVNEDTPFGSASKISVALLPTPTYPSRGTADTADDSTRFSLVPMEEKTRCIYVDDFPKQYIHDLCVELMFGVGRFPSKMHALEEMWFNGNTLHLQFASIQEAEKAHRIISIFHFRKYSALVHYGPDPCAAKVTNMDDLFVGGTIKAASHGFMGLKSLLETVGLASFSRSHEKASVKVVPTKKTASTGVVKMSFSALLSQTRTMAPRGIRVARPAPVMQTGVLQAESVNPLIDVSFGEATDTGTWSSVPPSVHAESASPVAKTPWTADQMVGLDMF